MQAEVHANCTDALWSGSKCIRMTQTATTQTFAEDEVTLPYSQIQRNDTVYHFCELYHASNRDYKHALSKNIT